MISPVFFLNWFFDIWAGGRRRPIFFDVVETAPALLELQRNYPVIRRELDGVLPHLKEMPRYHEMDPFQYQISGRHDRDKDWRVFMLYAMGEHHNANQARCPATTELLEQVPDLFQAFFSILDGGKSVPAHCGPYRGYLRYHLALKVPSDDPPTIRIKDQHYTWKQGEGILFDDSWEHQVTNRSRDIRVILSVDILRPMPRAPHAINKWITDHLIRTVYARRVLRLN